MKWDDDVLASLIHTLHGEDISHSDLTSEIPSPASPATPVLLVPLPRDKDEKEVEMEHQVENLRTQINTTNKNAVLCATMALGMIGNTSDVQPVDAVDAARDLQRHVARWITRKKMSQLKKDGAARQRSSASIQSNKDAKLERFREFCQAPVVLAMQDKYDAHQRVVAAIRDEIDPSGTDAQAILRAFRRIDLTDNKLITTTELRLALSEYGLELDDEAFGSVAREFDRENSGTISYNKFLGFFNSRRNETLETQTVGCSLISLCERTILRVPYLV